MYTQTQQRAIDKALRIVQQGWMVSEPQENISSPVRGREFMTLHLSGQVSREVFVVMFLNAQNQLIQAEDMFYGTLDGAAVYPREVVRRALELNAASVVLGHNHPSGTAEPSSADRRITDRLKDSLALMDIRVLDHIIVAGTESYSFAEAGLL